MSTFSDQKTEPYFLPYNLVMLHNTHTRTRTRTRTHYDMVSLTLSHTHFLILSLTLPLFLTAAKKSWEKISTSGSLTVLFCLDIINKGTIKAKFWTKFLSIMVAQHELVLFCSKKSPVLKPNWTSRSTP